MFSSISGAAVESEGCPIPVGDSVCGETNSLEIMKEFNQLYEERMKDVDMAGGDCLKEKIKLQEEWIRNLIQQNEMLVKAVQELEYEATERVHQLEQKLQKSAQCLCEVTKKYRQHDFAADLLAPHLQKLSKYEDDIRNILEFIRRIREKQEWNLDGLFFYNVSTMDLLGTANSLPENDNAEGEKILNRKDETIQDLTQKLNYYNSFGDVATMAQELQLRKVECDSLKQDMIDMREALTEEVAAKHDEIMALRREVQALEERCVQADKQTAFKEDIIKELRKEIKQLKVREKHLNLVAEQLQRHFNNYETMTFNCEEERIAKDDLLEEQLALIKILVKKLFSIDVGLKYVEDRASSLTNCSATCQLESLQNKIQKLESENTTMRNTLRIEKTHIEQLDEQFTEFLGERDHLKRTNKMLERQAKGVLKEKDALTCRCKVLIGEVEQLKVENSDLQRKVGELKNQLVSVAAESAERQEKIQELLAENRKILEQIVSLNEENRSLSENINVLRHRSEYTINFTQEEVSKLNSTIDQLRHTLEKTRSAQDEEEKAHERELALLNETINSLEEKVLFLEEKQQKKEPKACRICKVKSKVGFLEHSETQANLTLAGGECEELLKELNETKRTMESELEKRNEEIHTLKKTIQELELALSSCQERGTNLNEAVAFYTNSLRVLEESESETHLQIEQQKVTIANLQKALVGAKKDVEEMRKKNQENVAEKREMLEHLQQIQLDNELINKMVVIRHREFESLQDVNFELEIEHCDSLQDLDTLEVQLSKYKGLNQANEEQMKRLSKQKRCYEEVIAYFKHEMGLMADQLNNLQELLTLSNESAQEETSKVMQAFLEVQSLNDKLSSQLCACEQTAQLEGQMNQLHETKINELQRLLQEKDLDLTKHDQAILNIRKTLNDSLKQNEQLQETIVELNDTVAKLQRSVKDYEQETCAAKNSCSEFQEQIDSYQKKFDKLKRSLEDKTAECLKLEMAYNNEKRALKTAQKQLQEAEKARQDHQKELINSLDEFKIKLECSEQNYEKFLKECEDLRAQLASLTRKEAVKDLEIKRYRKIVGDLKATMMELNTELNKNLAQKALKSSCKNANCRANMESSPDNVCLSCPCEVEFYQNMVDILKQSVKELKRKLIESQQKCTELESDLKLRATQADELKSGRDKAIIELQREVDHLNQELQVKDLQLSDVKKSANEINGSKCVQLACAQEEIASLKSQIANLLNRQYLLKRENDDLHSQNSQFHCTVNCLNEKVRLLKEQIDQHLVIIKSLNMEKDTLIRKNRELLNELRSIQALTASMDKQQRFTSVDKQQLELDFEQLKCTKDDLCSESQNVIKNVRAWVLEQKKINSFVIKREKELIETIRRLSGGGGVKDRIPPCHHMCSSPCSLGSQGAGSMLESPPPSPDLNTVEWYSSTFRADSENDSEDDYCVNTLENLTEQMRRSNKMWMKESRVSRDQIKEKK